MKRDSEDGLLLTFPAADFRELARIILSYGADVRVEAPQELHDLVQNEISKMAQMYVCVP